MIQIAVAEDQDEHAKTLENMLQRYASAHSLEFQITRYPNADQLLFDYHPSWDIIFLDIEMPGTDGMTAAGRIRKEDPDVILIFVTNLAHYAINGYSVGAMDYILKPLHYPAFELTLDKAAALLKSREKKRILLSVKDEMISIEVRSIYYVEVAGHNLTFHTEKGDYSIRGSLKTYEEELGDTFAKCNSCYLVGLRHVTSVQKESVHAGPFELAMSRRSRNDFVCALTNYLGRRDFSR